MRFARSGRQPVVGLARPLANLRAADDRLGERRLAGCGCARKPEPRGERGGGRGGTPELEERPPGDPVHGISITTALDPFPLMRPRREAGRAPGVGPSS